MDLEVDEDGNLQVDEDGNPIFSDMVENVTVEITDVNGLMDEENLVETNNEEGEIGTEESVVTTMQGQDEEEVIPPIEEQPLPDDIQVDDNLAMNATIDEE